MTKLISKVESQLGEGIKNLQHEMHKGNFNRYQEFSKLKSDQRFTKWQVHCIFLASLSVSFPFNYCISQ